jgi:hypothetical protein
MQVRERDGTQLERVEVTLQHTESAVAQVKCHGETVGLHEVTGRRRFRTGHAAAATEHREPHADILPDFTAGASAKWLL